MIERTSPEQIALQKLLKEVREEAGLRQEDLAKAIDVSQGYISKLELGQCKLDLVQLREICQVMGISLVEFAQRFEASLGT